MPTIDIEAYFQRIGYVDERVPTLDTLRALHLRHTETIPFENLNPVLKRPVQLDLASLEQKLIHDRRGGYCFEQNTLFRCVLEVLGFKVTGLCARVLWNVPEGVTMPRTHMLLRVEVGSESYLADVGFGGQTLTGPLRLVPDLPQETPHEPYRLRPVGSEFVMEAELRGAWRPLYRFDLSEPPAIDYEVANWYVSTCPASFFTSTLIAARVAPGKRYALRDNEFAVHTHETTERRVLTSAAELRDALTGVFGIALPEGPVLKAVLERVAAKATPVH